MTYPPPPPRQPDPSGQYPPQQYGAPGYQQPPPYGAPPPGFTPPTPPKQKTKPWVWVVVAIAAVFVLCLGIGAIGNLAGGDKAEVTPPKAAGSGATKKAEKPAEDAADDDAGKTFNLAVGTEMTVTSDRGGVQTAVLRSVKTFKKGCNSLDVDPKQGMFVVVDVLVTQTKGTGSVNPLDWTLVTDDGNTADSLSSLFSGCDEPSLDSSNSLRAGQKRSGKIAFDVNSASGSVEFAPGGLGADTVGSWKLKS